MSNTITIGVNAENYQAIYNRLAKEEQEKLSLFNIEKEDNPVLITYVLR